jgi:hypothetical protein
MAEYPSVLGIHETKIPTRVVRRKNLIVLPIIYRITFDREG